MKNRISIGISSIVLIFLILCLAVFSLLSLSDANTALSFSERRAASVKLYYEADAAGQTFIRDFRRAFSESGDSMTAAQTAAQPLPEGCTVSVSSDDTVLCEIPLGNGQKLSMELSSDGTEILSYYVYNSEEYIIDTHMPVLGGE